MTRKAMFDAVRPLAPGRTFTPAQIVAGDAFADALGFPREGVVQSDPLPIAALKQDEGLPRIVSAVLLFGDERITIDRATGEVVEISHERRDALLKAKGSAVPTTAFETPEEYGQISAVLHDTAHLVTWRGDLQPKRWVTVDNPTARVPPLDELFGWRARYWAATVNGALELTSSEADDA